MAEYAVIFDMDGVLVDSYRAHFESWRRLGRLHGLDMTEGQFAETFGRTSRDIISHLWPDSVSEADIPKWDRRKEQFYREMLKVSFPDMDGAGRLLRVLDKAGFALAVGSSGPPENVQVVRDCLPGGELLAATVTGEEVTRGKPHPEVFLKAAEKLNVHPRRCAVIEDAPAGVEAARRAGMAAIALTGTASREKLAGRAHLVVDSLRELTPRIIAELIDGGQDVGHNENPPRGG